MAQDLSDIEARIESLFGVQHACRSISAAWEVVEKLGQKGFNFYLWRELGIWSCAVQQTEGRISHLDAPVAICKAAIKAVEDHPEGTR
jgi:hypothetical protein